MQEIAAGNIAAGLALGGLLVGMGIVAGQAASGSYTDLIDSVLSFVLSLLIFVIFYPVRQLVVQCLILGGPVRWRGILLDREIAEDKNVAAGLLEGTAYLATAFFVTYAV